jgi:hypothetical protein
MQPAHDLKSLDDLIAGLGGDSSGMQTTGPCGLLMEHLQAARRGLLGSMRGDYAVSLEQAKESLACISDRNSRVSTKATLQGLIDSSASVNAA